MKYHNDKIIRYIYYTARENLWDDIEKYWYWCIQCNVWQPSGDWAGLDRHILKHFLKRQTSSTQVQSLKTDNIFCLQTQENALTWLMFHVSCHTWLCCWSALTQPSTRSNQLGQGVFTNWSEQRACTTQIYWRHSANQTYYHCLICMQTY